VIFATGEEKLSQANSCEVNQRPYWPAWLSGLALGVVLLLTFVMTGHGLGATGFTTRLSAWLGFEVMPRWTLANDYLGPMVEDGGVLSSWITWQVLGVFIGALVSAFLAGRMAWRIEGAASSGRAGRLLKALGGGVLAGLGARIAAGCTSGVGLSGAAVLSVAGFVFLGAFFVAGLVAARLSGGGVK
jgi:uncharacterized membrane protein YedE/YeeE